MIDTYHPDRIIIEPSGVGMLSDVMKAVEGVKEECDLLLNSHITVADVNKCKMYLRNFGEFYENQIKYASTIILSRTDVASEDKVNKAVESLRGLNDQAHIVTTPAAKLGGKKILEVMENDVLNLEHEMEEEHHHHHEHDHDHDHHHDHEHHHHHEHGEECSCGCHDHDHHHHHHHADEVFTSWGHETARTYSREKLEQIIRSLSEGEDFGVVLRAKGMLPDPEGTWHYFDMVPEEYEIREGSPEFTGRICVIGSKLQEDKLEELFELV